MDNFKAGLWIIVGFILGGLVIMMGGILLPQSEWKCSEVDLIKDKPECTIYTRKN